jgi:AraC-like DNA-binding protein
MLPIARDPANRSLGYNPRDMSADTATHFALRAGEGVNLAEASLWPNDMVSEGAVAPRAGVRLPVPGGRKPLTFSTGAVSPPHQFEAWHASSAGAVEASAITDPAWGFSAERRVWTFGPFALGIVQAPGVRLSRDATQVRRSALDHWLITVATRGVRRVRVGDHCVDLPPGIASIASLNEIFVSERTDIEWVGLYVPRDTLPEISAALDASRHKPLDSAMQRILAAYLLQLAGEMPRLAEAELPRVVEATRALIAASIAPSAEAMATARAPVEQVQLARVKTIIRQQLRSAMLRPDRLCRLAGVSRSQLYRLFEPQGGVAHYIQAERLRAACRALASPDPGRDIAEIAADVGFFDHSTFSRIFRREFGCSPRDFRAAALAGQAAPLRRGTAGPGPSDLADLLRRL